MVNAAGDTKDCPACLGTGVKIRRDGVSEPCPRCGGTGQVPK